MPSDWQDHDHSEDSFDQVERLKTLHDLLVAVAAWNTAPPGSSPTQ